MSHRPVGAGEPASSTIRAPDATEQRVGPVWLARHRRDYVTAPARLVVYTVPPVGSGAGVHRELALSMADDIELMTLRLPGRERRRGEAALTTMDDCIADIAGRVAHHAADHRLPFALLGDCATSLVAYELGRALESAGIPPAGVVTVAGRSPRIGYREYRLHLAATEQLRTRVSEGGLMPPEITDDPDVFAMFAPTVRADLAVCEGYVWDGNPLTNVPVVSLVPEPLLDDVRFTSWRDMTRAWVRLVPMGGPSKSQLQVTSVLVPPAEVATVLAELRDVAAGTGSARSPATVHAQVVTAWMELLPASRGADDEDFLEVGGDSVLAVRLRNALQQRLGREPALEVILRGVTLGELVADIAGKQGDRGGDSAGS